MNILEKMVRFGRIDDILEECIAECSKEDLADGIKLLAINLGEYRARYGPLPAPDIRRLLTDQAIDDDTAMTIAEGMLQCAVALAQVRGRRDILEQLRSMDDTFSIDWKGVEQAPAPGREDGPPPHFRSERFFHHTSVGGHDDGWYFSVRGGLVYGPFPDEETARGMLEGLIRDYQSRRMTGGR